MPNYPKDLTGQTFGRLTVLARTGKTRYHNSLWRCLCECGEVKESVIYTALKSGKTQSCGGCLRAAPTKRETEEDWI